MSALAALAIKCHAVCLVDGRAYPKQFMLAVLRDEDQAERIARAYSRCRELMSHQHGVTSEAISIQELAIAG